MEYWPYLEGILHNAPPRHAESLLQKPCLVPLPGSELINRLLATAAWANMHMLLSRHMLSSLARKRDTADREVPEAMYALLAAVLPNLLYPSLEYTPWLVLPLPVIQKDLGRLIYILAGLLPQGRETYYPGNFSPEGLRAIEQARQVFAAMHPGFTGSLVLIPLLEENGPSITGGSLGLPLALALHLLHTRRRWPEGLYASGCLDRQGKILRVDGLAEKCSILPDPRWVFLSGSDAERYPGKTSVTPVETLSRAIENLEWILMGEDPVKAAAWRVYRNNPRHFLLHFHEIPMGFLYDPKSRDILIEIKSRLFEFLPLVTKALHNCTFETSRAALLTALFNDVQLLEIPAFGDVSMEIAVFDYSLARIAHANHIGDTSAIETWTGIQHRLRASVSAEEQLIALNHQFIAERFNRFAFREDIPPRIIELIAEEDKLNLVRFSAKRHLGAMYGTLCQNYGFCGPAYLPRFLDCLEKAVTAFGRTFMTENKRLDCYRFYGLLEAGSREEAVKALNLYLECHETAGLEEWIRVIERHCEAGEKGCLFTVSAILRGFADLDIALTADQLENMHRLLYDKLPASAPHPWQLILFNLARLLARVGKKEAVVVCLDRMVEICNFGGETMQCMGVLAFSQLHVEGLAEKRHYQAAQQLLAKVQQSPYLDQAHFDPLFQLSTLEERLQRVADERKQFFPFTYR